MFSGMALFPETNSLLCDRQFGFREGRNILQAILDLVKFIIECFENKEHVDTIFLDLSKTFDCV